MTEYSPGGLIGGAVPVSLRRGERFWFPDGRVLEWAGRQFVEVEADPLASLTDEDRDWLRAQGWQDPDRLE